MHTHTLTLVPYVLMLVISVLWSLKYGSINTLLYHKVVKKRKGRPKIMYRCTCETVRGMLLGLKKYSYPFGLE